MEASLTATTYYLHGVVAASSVAPAAGRRLRVRLWHKRADRSAAEHWPLSTNPFAGLWSVATPCSAPRLSFAVEHIADERTIGRITLREINASDARLGIYLAENYHGLGLGTEAMLLFGRIYFGQMLFERLKLDVALANVAARRLYHRLGFWSMGQEWRDVPHDAALALLALPEYQAQRVFYRQLDNGQWQARFGEYEISRAGWPMWIEKQHAANETTC